MLAAGAGPSIDGPSPIRGEDEEGVVRGVTKVTPSAVHVNRPRGLTAGRRERLSRHPWQKVSDDIAALPGVEGPTPCVTQSRTRKPLVPLPGYGGLFPRPVLVRIGVQGRRGGRRAVGGWGCISQC